MGISSAAMADKKLSKDHLLYGVSQFIAGNVTQYKYDGVTNTTPLKLFNPTSETLMFAALFYERDSVKNHDISESGWFLENVSPSGNSGSYQTCLVGALAPHGAMQINLNFLFVNRAYTEIISAPLEVSDSSNHSKKSKKSKKSSKRLRDGLGIRGTSIITNFGSVPLSMVHPELFSLPSDDEFDELSQRDSAIECVCNDLFQMNAPDTEVFEDFGISCSDDDF